MPKFSFSSSSLFLLPSPSSYSDDERLPYGTVQDGLYSRKEIRTPGRLVAERIHAGSPPDPRPFLWHCPFLSLDLPPRLRPPSHAEPGARRHCTASPLLLPVSPKHHIQRRRQLSFNFSSRRRPFENRRILVHWLYTLALPHGRTTFPSAASTFPSNPNPD